MEKQFCMANRRHILHYLRLNLFGLPAQPKLQLRGTDEDKQGCSSEKEVSQASLLLS